MIFVLNISFSVNGYANKLSGSSLELGINSFKEKEYWKAYSLLRPLAEQGIAEAQSIIGSMYRMGTPPTGKSLVVPLSGRRSPLCNVIREDWSI